MTHSLLRGSDERYGAALAALGVGPTRLRRLLDGFDPTTAWEAVANGCHPADPKRTYMSKARPALVEWVEAGCERTGAAVQIRGRGGYPSSLAADQESPAILFTLGDPGRFEAKPRVAIVGTRSATPYGLGVASDLGRGLAEVGVAVVSGGAPGIDTAAHIGALAAPIGGPPVAVLGTSFDASVSAIHARLRVAVAQRGAILSERTPGMTATPPWCFVVRARILAALAHVIVVVESHRHGGSQHTVKAASDRGVPVAAVPGSVRSSASAGTNALLVDGATPVRDVDDVLAVVELAIAGRPEIVAPCRSGGPTQCGLSPTVPASEAATRTLQALDGDPASLDTVVRRVGMPLGDVAEALEELAIAGVATGQGGWWSRP